MCVFALITRVVKESPDILSCKMGVQMQESGWFGEKLDGRRVLREAYFVLGEGYFVLRVEETHAVNCGAK